MAMENLNSRFQMAGIDFSTRRKVYGLQIFRSSVQGSDLRQRRAAAGVCVRLPHRNTRGLYSGHCGARSMPGAGNMPAQRGFCDPLAVYQTNRTGHYLGGHETGGMQSPPGKDVFSTVIEN